MLAVAELRIEPDGSRVKQESATSQDFIDAVRPVVIGLVAVSNNDFCVSQQLIQRQSARRIVKRNRVAVCRSQPMDEPQPLLIRGLLSPRTDECQRAPHAGRRPVMGTACHR